MTTVFLTKNGKGKSIDTMVKDEGKITYAEFRLNVESKPYSRQRNPFGLNLCFEFGSALECGMFFDQPRLINGIFSTASDIRLAYPSRLIDREVFVYTSGRGITGRVYGFSFQ